MKRPSATLLLFAGCFVAGCPRETQRPPPVVSTPTPSAESPEAIPSAVIDATAPEDPRTPIGNWGVEVFVPEGAESVHDPEANRHTIRLSANVSVGLLKVASPTRTERTDGTHERDVHVFDSGTTPNGVVYTILGFSVRVGVSGSRPGRHLHTFKKITRVFADLGIDAENRVECTGYLEHAIESIADPDVQMLRRICLSLRVVK